jgi:hypothetical protein
VWTLDSRDACYQVWLSLRSLVINSPSTGQSAIRLLGGRIDRNRPIKRYLHRIHVSIIGRSLISFNDGGKSISVRVERNFTKPYKTPARPFYLSRNLSCPSCLPCLKIVINIDNSSISISRELQHKTYHGSPALSHTFLLESFWHRAHYAIGVNQCERHLIVFHNVVNFPLRFRIGMYYETVNWNLETQLCNWRIKSSLERHDSLTMMYPARFDRNFCSCYIVPDFFSPRRRIRRPEIKVPMSSVDRSS